MSKPLCTLVLIACTMLISVGMAVSKPSEEPVSAKIVTVSRNDVHQVIAISGRLSYADESVAFAQKSGVVSEVCVKEGQRMAAGEALIRLEDTEQEKAVSAYVANSQAIANFDHADVLSEYLTLEDTVVRCGNACTVRELYVDNKSIVTVGTPVARLSSNEQEIICSVASVDAEGIEPGMWAWISANGDALGLAKVISVGEQEVDALTGLMVKTVILRPEQHVDLPERAAVDVEVYLAGSDDVLSLPIEAITERETVWWVNEGRCTEIPAQIVMCDEMHAWVNLPEGIQVAIGEFEEGQRVSEVIE